MSESYTWVKCPECEKKLAKKVGAQKFECSFAIRLRSNRSDRVTVNIVVGDITCPKCGHVLNFLAVPKESLNNKQIAEANPKKE